jgi:hypothetical protein
MGAVVGRINQILCGWTNYFRHAVCKHTLNRLRQFVDWRIIRCDCANDTAGDGMRSVAGHPDRPVAADRGRRGRAGFFVLSRSRLRTGFKIPTLPAVAYWNEHRGKNGSRPLSSGGGRGTVNPATTLPLTNPLGDKGIRGTTRAPTPAIDSIATATRQVGTSGCKPIPWNSRFRYP